MHSQPRKEGEVLEDQPGGRIQPALYLSAIKNLARRGCFEPDDDAQQGGLAAARRPQNGNDFLFANFEADIVKNLHALAARKREALEQVSDFQENRRHNHSFKL